MTYDTLLSLAPKAPHELLERIAGVLEEQPPPDTLLLISEGLYEAAQEMEMTGQAVAGDLRELAKAIAPQIMREPEDHPLLLVDQMHLALAGLVAFGRPGGTIGTAAGTLAWSNALLALARADKELGVRRD